MKKNVLRVLVSPDHARACPLTYQGSRLCVLKGFFFCFLFSLVVLTNLYAQTNDECLDCHSDLDLISKRSGQDMSFYVDMDIYDNSVHKEFDCIDCHEDAAVDEFPHPEFLESVDCGNCHEDSKEEFYSGIHGKALKRGALYAPTCGECHGKHDILPPTMPESRTYKINIPFLCGKCHREGAPVARIYNITEHNILENYSQSMHGEGLFKMGLIVSAACNDCHGNHLILPHGNPESSISLNNIANTCIKCHARIEQVHEKVIKGELWEREPGAIPACTDCHPPHIIDKETIVVKISDRSCLNCHAKEDIHKIVEGNKASLTVKKTDIADSVHKNIPCVKCHSDVLASSGRPCETAGKVDCSNCHVEIAVEYFESGHGRAFFKKYADAPYCTHCHGEHTVKSHRDDGSTTHRFSIPRLCGECHRKEGRAAKVKGIKEINALYDYSSSVHGLGLTEKGLLPSAICIDCHNPHYILKESDERSSVNPKNIPSTCATCHRGIYKRYVQGVHSIMRRDVKKDLPDCHTCHSAHGVTEIDQDKFMTEVTHQCGSCHQDLAETYLETMHGKAYQLGYLKSAKCSDCHGAHKILNVNNPDSSVGLNNVVTTCQKCHPDANQRFTGYLTHSTHHDRVKYPFLFYTFWAMTSLLIGTFGFFGLHTLLWIPRSMKRLMEKKKLIKDDASHEYYFRRFSVDQIITHIFVILSFIGLALTGMMLKFSGMGWASYLANLLGGVAVAGKIHRLAAVITFGYFAHHIYSLIRSALESHKPLRDFILGEDSPMLKMQDLKDFFATMKWFFGKGPRPSYGHWTYWEKFDYFAVFWGVAMIGLSGLMLWFPEFFARFLPGWSINIAQIIHSDEALLAVGFIFTIHFFNTHLRPEVFPMDTVIFTGVVSLEEYKEDRPREYEVLKRSGELDKRIVKRKIPKSFIKYAYIFGFFFLAIGITLIVLIIYSMLFGYR